jgi:hypothetical protein
MTTSVAGDAHTLDRQEHGEGLAGLVVPASAAQFFNENVIGKGQGVGIAHCDFTQNTHAEPGTRKRMLLHHLRRQTEFDAKGRRVLADQMEYLLAHIPRSSPLHDRIQRWLA